MSRKVRHPHRGITLILAIMIMSAVVAIGITLSAVLVFQVRINQVVKEGHQGYYAAESGMELGLNKLNTLKSGSLTDAITNLTAASLPTGADAEYSSYFYPTPKLLSQSAQVVSVASTIPIVQENQSVFIELYNVDLSLTQLGVAPTLCVHADGLNVGSGDSVGNEILEVSWVGWDENLNLSRSQKIYVSYTNFSLSSCTVAGITYQGFTVPLDQFYPAFTHGAYAGFRIRITPLYIKPSTLGVTGYGDVKNMAVYTNPNPPSQIQLKSVSSAAGQKQALVALFPWSLPLSSLFDFVIFSEKTITKSVPITIAQDLKRYGPFSITAPFGCTNTPPSLDWTCTLSQTPNPLSATNCGASCTYYIRLIANNSSGWQNQTEAKVNTTGTPSTSQDIPTLNAASCILKQPYVFTPGTGTITFTNKPTNLTGYELLTRPAFSTAEENYCP